MMASGSTHGVTQPGQYSICDPCRVPLNLSSWVGSLGSGPCPGPEPPAFLPPLAGGGGGGGDGAACTVTSSTASSNNNSSSGGNGDSGSMATDAPTRHDGDRDILEELFLPTYLTNDVVSWEQCARRPSLLGPFGL